MSAAQRKIASGMWKHICKQKHHVFRCQLYMDAEDMLEERALALALALHEEVAPLKRAEHEQSLRQIGAAWAWFRAKAAAP